MTLRTFALTVNYDRNEDKDLCETLSREKDSIMSMYKIIRVICNHTNQIFGSDDDEDSNPTILGTRHKEDKKTPWLFKFY